MQPAGDAVDVVATKRLTHRLEIVGRELVGVMELVAIDQVVQTLDGTSDLVSDRLIDVIVLRLIAAGDEPSDHRPKRPDADAGLHHKGNVSANMPLESGEESANGRR